MATFPERVLASITALLTTAFDVMFGVAAGLPPLLSLAIVSLITAMAMLLVVARVSDQRRVAATRRAIHASLFEIRLFNDDPVAVLRSVGDILILNLRYLRLSLVPLVWMVVPLMLIVAQLHTFYGYDGLSPGVPALVIVELRPSGAAGVTGTGLTLVAPPEIHVATDPVRFQGSNDVLWRIVPQAVGEFTIAVRVGEASFRKTVHVGNRRGRRSSRRVSEGLVDQLRYPSERPLDGPVETIAVTYPEAALDVAGWHLPWIVVYLAMSMGCAWVLARRVGVTL